MGVICQPGTFSSLEIGYAYIPDGGGRTVPIQEVDLPLWAFGEKTGEDPMDYAFRFKAEGVWHEVMVSLVSLKLTNLMSSLKDCIDTIDPFLVTISQRRGRSRNLGSVFSAILPIYAYTR